MGIGSDYFHHHSRQYFSLLLNFFLIFEECFWSRSLASLTLFLINAKINKDLAKLQLKLLLEQISWCTGLIYFCCKSVLYRNNHIPEHMIAQDFFYHLLRSHSQLALYSWDSFRKTARVTFESFQWVWLFCQEDNIRAHIKIYDWTD